MQTAICTQSVQPQGNEHPTGRTSAGLNFSNGEGILTRKGIRIKKNPRAV